MPSFSFLLCAFFFVCELVAKWLPEWAPLVLFQFVSPYYMQNHLFCLLRKCNRTRILQVKVSTILSTMFPFFPYSAVF